MGTATKSISSHPPWCAKTTALRSQQEEERANGGDDEGGAERVDGAHRRSSPCRRERDVVHDERATEGARDEEHGLDPAGLVRSQRTDVDDVGGGSEEVPTPAERIGCEGDEVLDVD